MGRVTGNEVRAGEGEPYFVERGADGRIERVIYPDAGTGDQSKPEYEYRYKYAPDGRVSEVALVYSFDSYKTEYGPEKYVIQFSYDDAGRLVRKVIRDNSRQDSTVRYETSYEFDGMGRMTRERIMQWDNTNEKMVVMQDKRTTYDLGGNPTEIKFYDNAGWAYTETRTYARGYQLTDFSTSVAGDVTINTAGSYTYDTNNNLTGTKKFDASRSGSQLSYRAQWSFTFDNKNRLKSYTHTDASNVRGNVWYDGKGRVWQRWNYDTNSEEWSESLKRFVYDGSVLVQEHSWTATVALEEWHYTYVDINRDYLRHPAGLRQREGTAASNTDYFMQADTGALEYKIERDPTSATADRTERSASLDQIAGASFTSDLSNLATSGDYIEMYGDSSNGFDSLVQKGGRHFITGLGRFASRMGNNAYLYEGEFEEGGIGDMYSVGDICPHPARGPKLPGYVNCCFSTGTSVDDCLKAAYAAGWFSFCCDRECWGYFPAPGGFSNPCYPLGSCEDRPFGHDCTSTHCDWSFGWGGSCGADNINIVNCGAPETIKFVFRQICDKARRCACKMHHDDVARTYIMWESRNIFRNIADHKDVWGCIAELCRTGNFTIECRDCSTPSLYYDKCCIPGYYGDSYYRTRNIRLCLNNLRNRYIDGHNYIGHNILFHEMAHLCGVALSGEEKNPQPDVRTGRNTYPQGAGAWFFADYCWDSRSGFIGYDD